MSVPSFAPFSLLPGARLSDVAALVGVPRRRLFWGVDSPGCVWLRVGGCAVFVAGTRDGVALARARWGSCPSGSF